VNVSFEIAMGLGLGLLTGAIWKAYANAQYAKMDAFNIKLKQAKREGLL
jgi:hypothetical protein